MRNCRISSDRKELDTADLVIFRVGKQLKVFLIKMMLQESKRPPTMTKDKQKDQVNQF